MIGAGETAEGDGRALPEQGVRTMFVANRRRERALEIAQRFGGSADRVRAPPAEARAGRHRRRLHLFAAPDLGAEAFAPMMAERDGRPLLLIDLAVPRDIDPAARTGGRLSSMTSTTCSAR